MAGLAPMISLKKTVHLISLHYISLHLMMCHDVMYHVRRAHH